MATYNGIKTYCELNDTDEDRVEELAESMIEDGWKGCPILYLQDFGLITGSHRKAALDRVNQMYEDGEIEIEPEVLDQEVAADVTDIINKKFEKVFEETGEYPEIRYDEIGWMFEGSWVEKYADEIEEW